MLRELGEDADKLSRIPQQILKPQQGLRGCIGSEAALLQGKDGGKLFKKRNTAKSCHSMKMLRQH